MTTVALSFLYFISFLKNAFLIKPRSDTKVNGSSSAAFYYIYPSNNRLVDNCIPPEWKIVFYQKLITCV